MKKKGKKKIIISPLNKTVEEFEKEWSKPIDPYLALHKAWVIYMKLFYKDDK